MEHLKLNGCDYYQYETIIETHPHLKYRKFKSDFIKHHEIPKKMYVHARILKSKGKSKSKDKWKVSNGKSKKIDKLFVQKKWIDFNLLLVDESEDDESEDDDESDNNALYHQKYNMKQLKLNGHHFYQYETIIEIYPHLKYRKNKSDFIKHHDIPPKMYIHAHKKKDDDGWTVSDGTYKQLDKLFVRKSWIDTNLLSNDDVNYLPPVIELEKDELFIDDNGVAVNITVVGTRSYDDCYFSVDDISNNFGLSNAHNTITKQNDSFIILTHYIYFINSKTDSFLCGTNVKKNGKNKKSQLFVTYEGLLKLLFTSRTGNTTSFIKWVTKTIFTAHLGSKDNKLALASSLIGASPQAIKEVFNTFADSLPCIYLFHLGTVKNLRKSMKIPDKYDDSKIVVKWGFSNDLSRRTKEHLKKNSYGGTKGSDISLLCNAVIDLQHMSAAETDIKEYFVENKYHFVNNKYNELAIISTKKLKTIKKQYTLIGKSYADHLKDFHAQIESIKKDIELANKEVKLANKNTELAKKDTELANKEVELAKKEIKLLRLQLKYAKKS